MIEASRMRLRLVAKLKTAERRSKQNDGLLLKWALEDYRELQVLAKFLYDNSRLFRYAEKRIWRLEKILRLRRQVEDGAGLILV